MSDMAVAPDYEIKSGGGDLFHPGLDPDAGVKLCELLREPAANPMAEVLRRELARGSYQMAADTFPYETMAARIAAALSAAGFGPVQDARAKALEDAADIAGRPENRWWAEGQNRAKWLRNLAAAERGEG